MTLLLTVILCGLATLAGVVLAAKARVWGLFVLAVGLVGAALLLWAMGSRWPGYGELGLLIVAMQGGYLLRTLSGR